MRIAIIPARGGSKRIPRKNIKPFRGKPMICWPIAAALEAGLFDEVIVSTDDDEIARIAEGAGALVPFRRPAALADDLAPTRDVIIHAIADAETRHDRTVGMACCIYATAAMLRADDLHRGFEMLADRRKISFVFAATGYGHPVHRALMRRETGGVRMITPEYARTRTQDLPEAFHDAGMFYWGRRDPFMADEPMFSPRALPCMIPRSRAQDIDTPEDWDLAETLFDRLSRPEVPA
jgi:pseudaminic acid cytidylyltransferase